MLDLSQKLSKKIYSSVDYLLYFQQKHTDDAGAGSLQAASKSPNLTLQEVSIFLLHCTVYILANKSQIAVAI